MDQNLAALRRKRGRNRILLLVAVDIVCVWASFLSAYWFRLLSGVFLGASLPIQQFHYIALVGVCALWVAIMSAHGLYRREVYLSVFDQMVGIFNSVNLGVLSILALAFLSKYDYFLERRLILLVAWALSIVLLILVRVLILRVMFLRGIQRDPFRCRILVVGAGESGLQFVQLVHHTKNHVFDIVGFLDDDPQKQGKKFEGHSVLGTIDDVERITNEFHVERIFVAIHRLHQEELIDLISRCMRSKVPVKMISDQFHMFASDATIERIDGVPTFRIRESPMRGFSYLWKRLVDLVTATVLLVILLPLFGVLAILITTLSPGPVLFRQTRAGQGGRPFQFYKFRTMRADADDKVHRDYATSFIAGEDLNIVDNHNQTPVYKMMRDPRVTGVGWILRKTSLDELPQLLNVLKGEMSLVGPRPPILYELQYYKEWHKRRLDAKPGLTGLWQVSGRSKVPFNEMVLLDLYYIDHWSLRLDFEILVRTVPVILFGKGAY